MMWARLATRGGGLCALCGGGGGGSVRWARSRSTLWNTGHVARAHSVLAPAATAVTGTAAPVTEVAPTTAPPKTTTTPTTCTAAASSKTTTTPTACTAAASSTATAAPTTTAAVAPVTTTATAPVATVGTCTTGAMMTRMMASIRHLHRSSAAWRTSTYSSASVGSAASTATVAAALTESERADIRRILSKDARVLTLSGDHGDSESTSQPKLVSKHPMLGDIHRATKDLDVDMASVLLQKSVALADQGILLPDTSFHSLLYIFATANLPLKAFQTYEMLLSVGYQPSENVLSKLVALCASNNDLDLAQDVINTMRRFNIVPHYRTFWKLIETRARVDATVAIEEVSRVMDELRMPYPGHSAYESMNDVLAVVVECAVQQLCGDERVQQLAVLFRLFETSNQPLGERLCAAILEHVGRSDEWDVAPTTIEQHTGRCMSCADALRPIALSDDDLSQLSGAVTQYLQHERVPDTEVASLKQMIENLGDVEIFIDGLNVGHFGVKAFQLDLVLAVAHQLKAAGYSYVVVLRRHAIKRTNRWQQARIDELQDEGRLLLLADKLSDDIRFICAAVQLRPHSYVLTNDMFRDHMYRVSKIPGGHLFDRWRRGHCISYDMVYKRGSRQPTINLMWPPKHDNVAQPTETAWHLPCVDNTWLCCAYADQLVG
ncbi:hypothetical protein PTSG_02169 [Salpingoeca rosetta]|uniref:ribonuclease P n=1 Tax=Salpingoeca rosetta (strain ATCC 50818 / BSB-021) TaxID=946362 RepID=F2U1E6_SALR5|nr:uncharacterized protein PTSG_02169 [Salpingoeca rosetta]EGD81448.1 hypothetical protein PTSG_02169 [Salpingoeca rosetta]|eukprot:XP_004996652.1 hypothetical protein PTSG_02169 [Salpingoeca rosetta]